MIDNSYWAGLFDGEGNIYISKGLHHMQVSITQKRPEILYLLKEVFGGGVTKYGKQTCHKWRVSSIEDIRNFLEVIYPYSIIKKGEISVALEFLKNSIPHSKGYRPLPIEEKERREGLRNNLYVVRNKVS